MNTQNLMNLWLEELGQEMGATLKMEKDTCTLDRQGRYQLVIQFDEQATTVHCWASLAEIPEDLDDDEYANFYEALLTENLTMAETSGARFALEPANGRILLCRSLSVVEGQQEPFPQVVASFITAADIWHHRFNDTEG